MRPSYGYGEALPYWTMRPAQGVVEPYYYTERYWPRPADTWGYCEGGPYEGSYPEWEEYYYGPHDSYAPPRYRGFRSPAYPFPPPPPPPRAFTFAHRPFHPSDQFRHPDEYPMRFVPVPLGYDYAASPPRMQAVKQEPFREMPNDKHCCGCPNHICLKGDDSHEKRIDLKEAANGNSDDCKTKKQLQEYPVPVIWFPDGRKQFPLDFNSNKSDGNSADDKTKQELQEYPFPVVWFPDGRQQFLPYFNSNKSLEDDRKQNVDKNLQCRKLQPFPFFWVPAGFKPYKDDVDDNAKAKNFDQEKKISNESISRSMPVEEPAKEMPKAREIPVKQILEEKPSNGGIFGSKSAEELGKEVRKVREIPVKQVLKENPSQALPAENREETKPSSPRSPRLPPVCLRVDPLPKKKVDGKNSSRSPSPSHKRTAVGTPAESVNRCEKNTQSNVSQVSPETKRGKIEESKSGKIEEQTNAQVKKSPEEGVCLRKKTRTMTEEEAAIIIQSFYRGYQIRRLQPLKKLREISKIKGRVNELNEQISNPELLLSLTRDPKAKGRFSETIMGLLLQLDTIQGLHPLVRDVRKSVARELVGLQEKLDQISGEFPQQIPTGVEAQEMKDVVSDDSTLNNYSENKQVDQETVNDEHLTKKQEAFFSSDLAREKPGVSPAEEAPNKEIVPSFTAEQATQAMDDAPETVTAKEGHDLAEAMVEVEHEMKQTIPAVYDAPDTVTAKEGDDDSAEAIVEVEQEKKHTIPAVNDAPGTVAGDEGHDFAEAMVEGEHENTLKIPAVNDAPETVEEGHDSADAMVEGEHENKQTIPAVDSVTAEEGHDSAEAMVKVEHENEQMITAVEDAMDSVTADEGDDSAEVKVEAECENKHAIQSVDSVGENEGKNLAEAVAEIDHKNDDEKSSPVVCKDIVEAAELKSDKAEGAELSTDGSISLAIEKEKPVECSVLSGVEEKKSVECSSKADKTEAAEAFNPSLDPTILSEEISTKSNELSTPSVEFSIKGQELVSRCDESSNLSIPGERCSVQCGDASNPAAEESEHVIDNHAIEAEIPRALEQPAMESEGERKSKSDLKENDDVRRKENWEEENERLKETVEKLMEAGKHQMSTIAELNDKIRYLESKLLNGSKGKGRRRARIGPMKVKNGVLFRRNAAPDKP